MNHNFKASHQDRQKELDVLCEQLFVISEWKKTQGLSEGNQSHSNHKQPTRSYVSWCFYVNHFSIMKSWGLFTLLIVCFKADSPCIVSSITDILKAFDHNFWNIHKVKH